MILWALPAGVTSLAIAALIFMAGRVAAEVAAVHDELRHLEALRAPVQGLRDQTAATRAVVAQITSR